MLTTSGPRDATHAEEEAPLMEETKVEPRCNSTRESMTKATTIQSERGVIGEATRDTEEKEGTEGALVYAPTEAITAGQATQRLCRMTTWF